jgi:CHAD domain-containing protein
MPASPSRNELLRQRLERFSRLLPAVEEGDVRAVHRARVATRRLRELLPVLQLDSDVAAKLGRRLRKVTVRLGSIRELDVLILMIDELRESSRHSDRALTLIADAVSRDRSRVHRRVLAKLPVAEMRRIARKLERAANELEQSDEGEGSSSPGASRGWRWAIDARLAKRAKALRAAMDDAGAVYLTERLHAVRIALKKLRYALELSAEMSGARSTPELQLLKRAQALLGRMHDLEVFIARVRQVQASLPQPDLSLWRDLDALVGAVENSCRRLHARYVRERPALEAICERVLPKGQSVPRRASTRQAAV